MFTVVLEILVLVGQLGSTEYKYKYSSTGRPVVEKTTVLGSPYVIRNPRTNLGIGESVVK